jgi:uncharacterized membrane protein
VRFLLFMILIENSISIKADVGKVFNFLADPEKLPKWNYYVKKVYRKSSGNSELGSRYRQIRKNDEQTFEITKFQKNKLIEFTTTPNSTIKFKRKLTFSENHSHCEVTDYFELDTGHPLILQKVLRYKIRKSVKENLMKLKQLLEMGRTILQDGRISLMDDNRD